MAKSVSVNISDKPARKKDKGFLKRDRDLFSMTVLWATNQKGGIAYVKVSNDFVVEVDFSDKSNGRKMSFQRSFDSALEAATKYGLTFDAKALKDAMEYFF